MTNWLAATRHRRPFQRQAKQLQSAYTFCNQVKTMG
jgi:hypothetical protein